MSLIIKGMEMPKNCKDCPFSDHQAWCLIPGDWRERYYCPDDEVSEHCPLSEVSDVDANAYKQGKWVIDEKGIPRCSECGYTSPHSIGSPFCQRCGAKLH